MRWFKLPGGMVCAAVLAGCTPPPGAAPPDVFLNLQDVYGKPFRRPDAREDRALVLLFLGHDCPISNGYIPELTRLHREYGPHGVHFVAVYADADVTPEEARRHAEEYGLP